MAAAIGIAKTATEIFLGVNSVSVDNFTFQLHYRWSVTLFIVSSVLVTTSTFFGDPVQCETAEDSVDDDVLNSFCWMYSSFDMPATYTGPCTRKKLVGTYLYNTYYQWVPIFLAMQAALFYFPRCIWIVIEDGLMAHIVKGCTGRHMEDKELEEKIRRLLKHYQEHIHNKYNTYAFGFFLCELLNTLVALLSVFLTHKFLLDQYYTFGWEVYRYYMKVPEERLNMIDPVCELFPKMAACHYYRYGMGGIEDDRHSICVLGLNMINDKVFIATWCWHLFIVFMGTLRIFTRSPQLVSAQVRYFLMKSQMERYFKKNAHLDRIKYYLLNCSIGNWYILYQISKNINPRLFAEFITVLAETINPDPTIENEEPEIYFSSEDLEKHKNGTWAASRRNSLESINSTNSNRRGIMGCEDELDTSIEPGGAGVDGIDAKQKMLIKKGKVAVKAKAKMHKASVAIKRMRRR